MIKLNNLKTRRAKISLFESMLLILSVIAFAYMLGESMREVSAGDEFVGSIVKWLFKRSNFKGGFLGDPAKEKLKEYGLTEESAVGWGGFMGGLAQSLAWAGLAYGLANMVGGFFGLDKGETKGVSLSLAAGFGVYRGVYLLKERGWWFKSWTSQGWGVTAGIITAAIVFYFTYEKTKTKTFTIECKPWSPPTGGENCEKCNNQELPCSEYQCRSLGQSCQLLNKGTGNEKCAWVNRNDVKPPVITPWDEVLSRDHEYTPDNTISPPDRGVKIINKKSSDGCLKAFTPIMFGIRTNEPAMCRIDYIRKANFSDMDFYFGGTNQYLYNHTQLISLPSPNSSAAEGITLRNNGDLNLYVRCMDANGNTNPANFVFRMCVEKGPDTTPPIIIATNLRNNMPIAFNKTELPLTLYINEPAECRWSRTDQNYEDMEHDMTCATSVTEINAQMTYECKTILRGIENGKDNNFYFRCKDKPHNPENERNTNTQSFKFTIKGTQPLVIKEVGPNETIKGAASPVKVILTAETIGGYQNGKATCYYKNTNSTMQYVAFLHTNSNTHSQELYFPAGRHTYSIKCIDLGGNSDVKNTTFYVDVDVVPPEIVRVTKSSDQLIIMTNEEARCVYSTRDCNYEFEQGTEMTTTDKITHTTTWNQANTYYIKCKDNYGNIPYTGYCTMIVKPTNEDY